MPRRGAYTGDFPGPRPPRDAETERVGIRQVCVKDGLGRPRTVSLIPSEFRCSKLAAELADEWVELSAAANHGPSSAAHYRQAIEEFCRHVDTTVPRCETASLAMTQPDLHHAVTEWIRLLPSGHTPGSRMPGLLAGKLRILVGRRIEHPHRPVAGQLPGWVEGALGLRRGQTDELDEFTRADKKKIVQAAWADRLAIETRIRTGWGLAAQGRDPAEAGWEEPANLLWAIAHEARTFTEIGHHLPKWSAMATSLRSLLPEDTPPRNGKRMLMRHLVNQLFLHNRDLQPYRVLLMAATGRTSEEVAALDEDDIEYGPNSVMIDFSKGRAQAQMRQAFSAEPAPPTAFLHPRRPKLDASEITRRLLELTRPLARRAGISPVPLFLRASLPWPSVTASPMDRTTTFADWLQDHGVSVEGPPDIRRLRKSGKVEKAITFKGRVSDIADDHSVETFRNHYAHGTTLKVISGNVITGAQQRWFKQALEGPVMLTEDAEQSLKEPGSAAALGLTEEDVERLRSGQLDMGVSSCKDPFASPFGQPGQLCPVAPTRCLECRNAFVLPSNLPQLLLFAAHLEQLQLRLAPQHFHALWGQSRVNIDDAIKARTDAEIAQARRQIADDGLTLQLPLATHVEFDA
ncbi:hypothetical protein [Streptomyces halstedii]|uniref:hypothetical protein n=1 Tax=Streptomyces halstedii TaxID=1944 RepID=UPI00345F9444